MDQLPSYLSLNEQKNVFCCMLNMGIDPSKEGGVCGEGREARALNFVIQVENQEMT